MTMITNINSKKLKQFSISLFSALDIAKILPFINLRAGFRVKGATGGAALHFLYHSILWRLRRAWVKKRASLFFCRLFFRLRKEAIKKINA